MEKTKALATLACLLTVWSLAGRAMESSRPSHPLQQAAYRGDIALVKSLLAQEQDQYLRDSALRFAVRAGHREIAELLISYGARYALVVAAEEGDAKLAESLLAGGPDANQRDSALFAAARTGRKEIVELLLKHGADVNAVRFGNLTSLLVAAARGGDLNAFNAFAISPPAERKNAPAAPEAFRDIVRLLIDHGADVNAREKQNGYVPLHYAIWGGDREIARALLDHGAVVNPEAQSATMSWHYITPLHLAAQYGDLAVCEMLIARGADVNSKMPPKYGILLDNPRQTPLYHAIGTGNVQLVRLLIDHGAEVNIADGQAETPLHRAAERANRIIVELLLSHDAQVDANDDEGKTPLHYAATRGDPSIVEALLSHGADASRRSRDGQTPTSMATQNGSEPIVRLLQARLGQATFHSAASMGDIEALERLVKGGVDVNRLDAQGQTALHAAANAGQLEAVRWLVEHGANIDLADDKGSTALSIATGQAYQAPIDLTRAEDAAAAESKYKAVMAFLIARGAKLRFSYGIPQEQVQSHGTEVAALVIAAGPDFEDGYDPQATLLHRAAWWGRTNAVEDLIKLGADLNAVDRVGGTPLHAATQHGSTRYWDVITGPHEDVLKLLLEHSARVDAVNNEGQTALHCAVGQGNVNAVDVLIRHGASVNGTVLHAAASCGDAEIMTLLLEKGADRNAVDREGNTPLLELLSSFELRRDDSKAQIRDYALKLLRQGVRADVQNDQGVTPLQLAAGQGFSDVVKELLSRGARVDLKTTTGWTALHAAVHAGNAECAEILIRHGAPVDGRGRPREDGARPSTARAPDRTPLQIAAWQGHDDIVRMLIDAGADVRATNDEGKTPLHLAFEQNRSSTIALLLERGADANTRRTDGIPVVYRAAARERRTAVENLLRHGARADAEVVRTLLETGTTPLHEAAANGDTEQVRKLLDGGMEANIPDRQGSLPIHLARANRHLETAKLLLPKTSKAALTGLLLAEVEGGSHELIPLAAIRRDDLNTRNWRGETPLHQAVNKRNVRAIEVLLEQGADINAKDINNETPLGAAVYRGQKEIVALLLSHGAEVNNAHKSHELAGCLPLHVALRFRHWEIAEMLVRHGSDVNARGGYGGMAPLHMAMDNRALFELMLQHGGRVDTPSGDGSTCLHWAATTGQDELVQYLLDKDASVNVQNRDGNTPLHLAAKGGRLGTCRILVAHKADASLRNKRGLLALDYAWASDVKEIVDLLR